MPRPALMLALDLVNTIAIAGVVLFAGYGLRRIVPALARLNIPAPVVGGLIVAIAMTVAHARGSHLLRFDTTLQTSLQNAFFTSIGFGASVQLLRLGGPLVIRFFLFAAAIAILQNVVGAVVAIGLGPPAGEDPEAFVLLKHLVLMLVAMWIGGFVSRALAGAGFSRSSPSSPRWRCCA